MAHPWYHNLCDSNKPLYQADERCEFTVLLVSGQVSADLHCIIN
jgi:hypothetical protein